VAINDALPLKAARPDAIASDVQVTNQIIVPNHKSFDKKI